MDILKTHPNIIVEEIFAKYISHHKLGTARKSRPMPHIYDSILQNIVKNLDSYHGIMEVEYDEYEEDSY